MKGLITAIFLSQALIATVSTQEGFAYGRAMDTRSVYPLSIPLTGGRTRVVPVVDFAVPKAPVPYYQFWDCAWRQTAQQCVAIYSTLQQELGR